MAKENIAKYIILGLLSHEPSSGYEIKKKVEFSISYFWDISYGQIYPTLKMMEEEGLAIKEIEAGERGPSRKRYSITENGRKELLKWLHRPEEKEYEILLKMFFGAQLLPDESIEKIREFSAKRTQELGELEKSKTVLSCIVDKDKDHLYFLLVALFGIYSYKVQLKWSEVAIDILEEMKKDNIKTEDIMDKIKEIL